MDMCAFTVVLMAIDVAKNAIRTQVTTVQQANAVLDSKTTAGNPMVEPVFREELKERENHALRRWIVRQGFSALALSEAQCACGSATHKTQTARTRAKPVMHCLMEPAFAIQSAAGATEVEPIMEVAQLQAKTAIKPVREETTAMVL